MQKFIVSLRIFLLWSILLGLGYPFLLIFLGKNCCLYQANGSLLVHNNKIIGSALIAQKFTSPKYFHSRFSTTDYNAAASGSTSLSPTNEQLYIQTQKHIQQINTENNFPQHTILPADMVFTSASSLDPHVSLTNAQLQLPRVAMARNIAQTTINDLIEQHRARDFIGLWGQAGVNILQLNLALDKLETQ